MPPGVKIAIIGGGPAGLFAAERAALGGAEVTLFEGKTSVGRKFLVAGRGGLNLTHDEPPAAFAARYLAPGAPEGFWAGALEAFGPGAIREWAEGLGIETFAASTGRVYPRGLKAAPLLRRWVARLRSRGVRIKVRHRLKALSEGADGPRLEFATPEGPAFWNADAAILALGGGSWPETGSDGAWVPMLQSLGVAVTPLEPANCGWETDWPPAIAALEGTPLKNIRVHAGAATAAGELLITHYGLEGGALYQVGPALRLMTPPEIVVDLKPSNTVEQLLARLGSPAPGNLLAQARTRWRLGPAAGGLLETQGPFASPAAIAAAAKACRVTLRSPRPLAEAISSAGGVRFEGLTGALGLRTVPGVFVAGEMADWEAPTGGFLLQGCFATGALAARGALEWIAARRRE